MTDFLQLSKEAYESSTGYIDSNYRKDWDYSIRAFRNEHAPGSKYLSEDFRARSRLFRPKTRAVIRKNEAAGAIALFSNMEVVNVTPGNPDDVMSVASCEAMKQVLEYRLTRTIPTYQICLGGLQDAQVTGTVVSYQYWEYEVRNGRKIKDKPCIELRPIENIRLDAGASWIDPIGTSPYLCDIIPMYVCDVKAMMNKKDEKTGAPVWKKFDDAVITRALPDKMDSTRKARIGTYQDPQDETSPIKAFDIVWVMRWFMKNDQGDDYTYYTLGTEELLTDPKPIAEVYFHGKRPYVMGYCVLETHKPFKSGIPLLTKHLQQETNDVANQRIDNVKFVLNKRWIVARGRQTDVQSLVRNVPGGVTLTTNPKEDIQESNWPDVTSSAYVEQDRLNSDFDDIAGNFSPSTKVANNAINDTLGGSRMANMAAGMMSDYLIRTFIETWYEPVLRQLILLEQYYETDEIVLAIAAKKARLFPRFGISAITDQMLMEEVNLNVNVGMGSSNPNERMQKFLMATNAVISVINSAPPSMNVEEMAKEIYSNAGMRDGSRFFTQQGDPRLPKAIQMIQQLQSALQSKQMDYQAQAGIAQLKLGSDEKIKAAELQVDISRIHGDLRIREAELAVEREKLNLEMLKLEVEMQGASAEYHMKIVELGAKINEAELKLKQEHQRLAGQALKLAQELEKGQITLQTARENQQRDSAISNVADTVAASMSEISKEIDVINSSLTEARGAIDGIGEIKGAVSTLKNTIESLAKENAAKKKAVGMSLRKSGGKTSAVSIQFQDGTSDELPVQVSES